MHIGAACNVSGVTALCSIVLRHPSASSASLLDSSNAGSLCLRLLCRALKQLTAWKAAAGLQTHVTPDFADLVELGEHA